MSFSIRRLDTINGKAKNKIKKDIQKLEKSFPYNMPIFTYHTSESDTDPIGEQNSSLFVGKKSTEKSS